MLTLINKTITVNLKKLLIYLLITFFFLWMFVAFYGSIQGQADEFSQLIDLYPEAMLEALGIQAHNIFSMFRGFLAAEYFSIIWPIMLISFVVGNGGALLSGEIDNRSIEVLLSLPLSRAKIYLAKYFAGLIITTTFVFFSIYFVIPFLLIYKIDFELSDYLPIFLLSTLAGFFIHSLTFFISSIFSSSGKTTSLVLFIVVGMYALNILSSLQEKLNDIKYFSFFYYFDYNSALIDLKIESLSILVFIYFGIIASILGLVIFSRRDIAT